MPLRSARGLLLVASVGLAASSCKRQAEPEAATPAAEVAPSGPPKGDAMTYVSGAKHGGATQEAAPAGDDAQGDDAAPTEAKADEPALVELAAKITTAEEARRLAEDAAGEALGVSAESRISPALTPTWPPTDLTLIYLAYPMAPIEGTMKVKVGKPVEIRVNLEDGAVATKRLKPSSVVKTLDLKRESAAVRQNLATAEQALVNVLLRKRSVARSFRLLDGYREWFNENLEFMTDFSHRYGKAMRFFKDPSPSAEMP
ncbi:MAG: hypothetical protein KC636_02755 [Myxococcales bacterium]|nr:hypothetical protein [Myxococcales bacterium]